MDGPFYASPGWRFEPGDIFSDIPFPTLKHPLEFFRASPNPRNKGGATLFVASEGHAPQLGDTARGPFTKRTVVLLSWECEIDAVFRDQEKFRIDRRCWLAAPVRPVSDLGEKMRARTLEGRQPNKFLLPPDSPGSKGPFGDAAQFADLRLITPIPVPYFVEAQEQARKLCSLSTEAILSMQAHLGLFFSGLVIYVQSIPCPACGQEIDPTVFVARSVDEPDPE